MSPTIDVHIVDDESHVPSVVNVSTPKSKKESFSSLAPSHWLQSSRTFEPQSASDNTAATTATKSSLFEDRTPTTNNEIYPSSKYSSPLFNSPLLHGQYPQDETTASLSEVSTLFSSGTHLDSERTTAGALRHTSSFINYDCDLREESEQQTNDDSVCFGLPLLRHLRRATKLLSSGLAGIGLGVRGKQDNFGNEIDDDRSVWEERNVEHLRRNWEGDVGLALFSPFDETAFEPVAPDPTPEQVQEEFQKEEEEEEDFPLLLVPDADLQDYPRILSEEVMKEIQKALPASVSVMSWTRAYCLARDGDHFQTMLRMCSAYRHTLVVVQTTLGDILGGFADAPWEIQQGQAQGFDRRRSFYGSGRAFLFASNPSSLTQDDANDEGSFSAKPVKPIHIYRWTGENNYCQVCDDRDEQIAMGGGGSFGFILQDYFTRGSTGRCTTFDNPPLAKGPKSETYITFEILNLEVYGFKTMLY